MESKVYQMACLLFGLLSLSSCTSFLYFPNNRRYVDAKSITPPPQEIFLNASEDDQLMNWFFPAVGTATQPITVIFTHGNGQNMSAHFRSLHWLPRKGINYLIVEYPGYGPNAGSPSPASTVEVTRLAMDWVRKNRSKDQIFLFGQSLGGNVMLRALSEYPEKNIFCGVAIEASFSSYQQVAQKTLSRNWLLWLFQWMPYLVIDDSRAIAGNFQQLPDLPYLVIHGNADQTVPFKMGQELFQNLPHNKTFWEVEQGRHIDTFFKHPFYRERFVEFILQSCPIQTVSYLQPPDSLHPSH